MKTWHRLRSDFTHISGEVKLHHEAYGTMADDGLLTNCLFLSHVDDGVQLYSRYANAFGGRELASPPVGTWAEAPFVEVLGAL